MAQLTDVQLLAEKEVIKTETITNANTAERIGQMLEDIIDSKVNNDEAGALFDPAGSAAAAQAASQPVDADLTAIAALTPSNDDVLQRKAGVWTNRTLTQLGADLQTVNIGNLLYLHNNFI